MRYIDNFLNNITMYRLVLYGTAVLGALGIVFAFVGVLPFNGPLMLLSMAVLVFVAYAVNILFGKLFTVPVNSESSAITGFILFLVLAPASSIPEFGFLALAAVVAMASKFLLSPRGKIIFNPAALAAVLIGIPGLLAPIWWIASVGMTLPVLVVSFLIVRKVRRISMALVFIAVAVVGILIANIGAGESWTGQLAGVFVSWPILFFAGVMLTEPSTTPGTKNLRTLYAAFVGVLFVLPFNIGPLYNTPELALVIGNLFSYVIGFKQRAVLYLKEKIELGPMLYEFVFVPNRKISFAAGQYLEWTLSHSNTDTRGNRRYFTIASSPEEDVLRVGVKVADGASSFKRALSSLPEGGEVFAGQLSGNFTLPEDTNQKIVGIAGGIGITPFRSQVQHMLDTNQKRDFVLFYAAPDPAQFVYEEVFAQAEKLGVKIVYVLSGAKEIPASWQGKTGFITKEMIQQEVSDYQNRMYYLSGPNVMVENYVKLLRSMGVSRSRIKTDYFPGY
jgi:glycine betaine catabolism B